MTKKVFKDKTTRFLQNGEPFFFIVNFNQTEFYALRFEEAREKGIFFDINSVTNQTTTLGDMPKITGLEVDPYPYPNYVDSFGEVIQNMKNGNSFLLNLTFPSKIKSNIHFRSIFNKAKAPYKLLYKDEFVCFSPECFIKIEGDHIYSHPMKGTMDASLPEAKTLLLNDPKEEQEHNTIVDLIRNDLSSVAKEVTVTKFRYLEKITTVDGELLQTSSEIRGKLPQDWKANFANILFKMLPAGSISGAPKPKTVEIIHKVEQYDRGFYTGIFGLFDGRNIDSAVAIRFIEQKNGDFWYKSGGGITHQSNVKEEYAELLKKIYIPTV